MTKIISVFVAKNLRDSCSGQRGLFHLKTQVYRRNIDAVCAETLKQLSFFS